MSSLETLSRSEWRAPLARVLPERGLVMLAALLVAIDQAAKLWVLHNLPYRAHLPLVGDVLWLAHYANYGAIGGLGGGTPWVVPALVFAAVVLVAALLGGYGLYRAYLGSSWRIQLFVILAVAPLVSTALDRVRLGYVVDFLYLPGLPVFNIGDLLPHFAAVFAALEVAALVKRR